jgi:hypothetical protein
MPSFGFGRGEGGFWLSRDDDGGLRGLGFACGSGRTLGRTLGRHGGRETGLSGEHPSDCRGKWWWCELKSAVRLTGLSDSLENDHSHQSLYNPFPHCHPHGMLKRNM